MGSSKVKPNWAAFLDRDGVLVDDTRGPVCKPEDLRLLPGAAEAVKRLKEAGALAIVVSNQPAVAKALLSEETLQDIHRLLEKQLASRGARLDAIYYCPHHPETHHPEANDPRYRRECDCRKPKIGMFTQAVERFSIDLERSFMIGDSTRDIEAARNAGCRVALVRTGNAGKDGLFAAKPDAVCDDVAAAADWVLQQLKKTSASR